MKFNNASHQTINGVQVFCDQYVGAILQKDNKWYPFCFFADGNYDILEEGYSNCEAAYYAAQKYFT